MAAPDAATPPPKRRGKPPRRVRTPTVLQMEAVECGAASLSIILRHYGLYIPLERLRVDCGVSRDGSKANNVLRAARKYGMEAKGFKYSIEQLMELKMPVIIFWNFNHFLVLEGWKGDKVFLSDPATGPRAVTVEEFEGSYTGVVLCAEPGAEYQKGGEKPSFWTCLRPRLTGYQWPVVFVALTGLFLVIPGLVIPAFTRVFIDDVLVSGKSDWVKPILLGLGLTALASMVLTYLQQYFLLRFETKLALTSSLRFFRHVLHLPVEFFSQRFGGEIGSRVAINDKVAKVLSEQVATLLLQMVTCVFFAILMFQYDWLLALIAIAFGLVNVVAMRLISRKRVDTSRRLLQERGKLMGTSMGGLQMIETLKATGGEAEFFSRWAGYQAKALKAKQQLGLFSQMIGVLPPLLTAATTVGVLVVGGLRVIDGHLTMGMLVAFQTIVASFNRPIGDFVTFGGQLQELQGDMNRLDDVTRYQPDEMYARAELPRPPEFKDVVKLTGRLEIRNLSFGYSPLERPLIEDFNLIIEPGQRVALVGGSGSGKSTVAKIVAGLYKPWTGEILFDGIPREQVPPDLLNNSIGMVDQEIFLFQGTVRDNLTMWDNTIPDTNIFAAMADAAIGDIVAARPGAENSAVSEGGNNFSGGQRQRLEIARALVGNPTFLILDEATSALDPTTEKEIDTNLRRRGCSSLTVAHRLSTIRDSDEIIVMNRGRIVQRGTHEEMKNKDGFYKHLIKE
ncbi:MAG: NHLP family bacteriocin export ABC transporter peptidase/permease/ATPase subunit [Verrucomicrobiales bacterium]